jgi:putative transposase
VKYAFIKLHEKIWPIAFQCRIFSVCRSGFYAWKRSESKRKKEAQENQLLDHKIKAIFCEHKQRYGSPRITHELKSEGINVNHKRVEKRMNLLNLKAKQAKKFKATTDSHHDRLVAPNLLNQDFTALAPNQKWAGDITYIWTREGWIYLAVIMDLFNREIIGWAMSHRINRQPVCDALSMALWRKGFPKNVIILSDRGSQYCSNQYQKLINSNKLQCSMSGKGCCYDNAVSETFFHSLKVEMIHDQVWNTRSETKKAVFEYIEIYYNRKRRHSTLGYKSPVEFANSFLKAS